MEMVSTDDRVAIEAAVRDYLDGWMLGDPERMDRGLHPGFTKRRVDADRPGGLLETTKEDMVDGAARRLLPRYLGEHGLAYDPGAATITIHVASEGIASVHCDSAYWLDLLHVARTNDGWKLVNALWRGQDTDEYRRLRAWMRVESPW